MSHTFDNYCLTIDSSCIFTIAVTGDPPKIQQSLKLVSFFCGAKSYRTCQYRITESRAYLSCVLVSLKNLFFVGFDFHLINSEDSFETGANTSLSKLAYKKIRSITLIYTTIQTISLILSVLIKNSGHFPTRFQSVCIGRVFQKEERWCSVLITLLDI